MKVLNDILGYNLKIYQNLDWFCFSIDSVILANFPRIKLRTKKILDLGSGNGIIPIILSQRTCAYIDGVEIQKDLVQLSEESIEYNKLNNRIKIYNQDMKEFVKNKNIYNTYDLIVSNPPYFRKDEKSTKNLDIHKVIARHEVKIDLEEIFSISAKLLKEGGIFATVNRVDRFMEILELYRKYKIEPKYIRFVYDNINIQPNLFYVEGIKNGKSGLNIDKPFIMFDSNGIKTSEYKDLIQEVMK